MPSLFHLFGDKVLNGTLVASAAEPDVINATEAGEICTEDVLPILSPFIEEQDRNVYNQSLPETTSLASTCRCSEYHDQIENSNSEIKHLTGELHKLKEEIDNLHVLYENSIKENIKQNEKESNLQLETSTTCSDSKSQAENSRNEIQQLAGELLQLKKEVESMKRNQGLSTPFVIPPPPPPPPPPLLVPNTIIVTKSANKKDNEEKSEKNLRPVISLEDILNVKLKKSSEKVPNNQTSIQPAVSVEMLKQVKLKPVESSRLRVKSESNIMDVILGA